MIRGTVNARREAIVRLRVRKPGGVALTVDAVIDAGFSGALALSAASIVALGLVRRTQGKAVLANGSVQWFDVFPAEVALGGWRPVLVSAIGVGAVIGMRLLAGHELRVAVVPGGDVEITPLP